MINLKINYNLKTQEQKNIAEQIEILMIGKKSFESMLIVTSHLTSAEHWTGIVTQYNDGYYIELEGLRSQCKGFINNNGNITRKPQNIIPIKKYKVVGDGTEIRHIS